MAPCPQPPAPGSPPSSLLEQRPCPASAGRPSSPGVGATALGARSGRQRRAGLVGPGRGINVLPRAGPLLRKDTEPSSGQWGRRALPPGPGCLVWPSHVPPSRPRSLGGGGSEVELLYLGTGDELEAFLLLARSLRAAMCSLQGPQEPGWVHGSRSTVGSLGPWPRWVLQQGPHHSVLPGTLATSPAHLSCSALFPFRPEGCLCHKLAMPHFLQASSRARPGSPNTASGPTEAPGVSRVGACHRLPTQEQARDALDVPRNGTPHPRAVPTRLRTRPSTQDAKALPGPSLTRGAGAPRPPPSTGIWRAVTWHPPHRVSGPQGRSGRVGPPDQRD